LNSAGLEFSFTGGHRCSFEYATAATKAVGAGAQILHYDENRTKAPINPNATVESLVQIPTVELSLAKAVVQNRMLSGPYRDLADFQRRLSLPVLSLPS